MPNYVALTGNEAVATAMKQIGPDVVAAYPITPQTSLMQKFASFVADGEVDTEMILVESEHSAMSAAVGAAAAGARTMTATSANGLALMWEIVYIAASSRLPIVMPLVNRALSAPINIHCDHSDAMGVRDSGWIQLWSENAQEAYDNTIQAVKIAEDPSVRLPVIVNLDGFVISHGMENVDIYPDERIKSFTGEYKPLINLLDIKNPITIGPLDLQDYYFEHKRQQAQGMMNAEKVIEKVASEFKAAFGKGYGIVEGYKMEDAEFAIVGLGSTMGTLKMVVDEARKSDIKAGLLKIRVFRPFPRDRIRKALSKVKAIAVLDRADSFNAVSGPLYSEITSALYGVANIPVVNYIYGLGGRDISVNMLHKVVKETYDITKTGKSEKTMSYLGVRE
ncbi:MAG: pyruvate ferredoxin oxidoreductase [Candidatus Omnitrophica bacterium]|nr:pyruvate ferredoxin oxidoreductase [Candidatus Omnitrophota bacterium]